MPFRTVDQIAHRPHLAVALVAALAVLLCSAGALWRPPAPAVHDEFSYLLAADTFSSGRLFNPTHPMWKHFETIHVIWQPVYASKYLPAQGLLLALGQTLTGHAIVGSWIGVAAACAAILWMLQGWLPPRWALFGGMLTATHPYIVGAWGHGYWGGALTAAAGALVYGALPRLAGPRRRQNAVAFAIGLVLLAWTRPFEGFLIGTPACLWLAWQYRPGQPGSSQSKPRKAAELAIPIATICVAGAAMLLFYNFRLTGDALKFPYMIHEETYAEIPPLLWQDLRPPVQHRHQVLDDFWSGWAAQAYRVAQTPGGFITTLWLKATHLASHYTASPLAFLLLLVPMALWRRRRRLALIAIATGFLLVGIAQISWIYTANYIAPGLCLLVLLMVQAARYLRGWRRHGPLSGRMLLRIIVLTHLAACIAAWPGFLDTPVWAQQRERIARRLDAQPGRNLILVQYGGADVHDPHAEWVYNEADIDRAKTIWARTMGATRDAELLNYYRDRTFWLLHADEHPIRLEKIDRSATSR